MVIFMTIPPEKIVELRNMINSTSSSIGTTITELLQNKIVN